MPAKATLSALRNTLRALSDELPGATEYVMVHHPAFRVGTKPFAIAGLGSNGGRVTVSINLGLEMQLNLLGDSRFSKTPYLGRHGWVSIAVDDLANAELATLVRESYLRVASAKQRARLAPVREKRAPRSAGQRAPARTKAASRPKREGKPPADAEAAWRALGLAAPARRALVGARLYSLADLKRVSDEQLQGLHGMGPAALSKLRAARDRRKSK